MTARNSTSATPTELAERNVNAGKLLRIVVEAVNAEIVQGVRGGDVWGAYEEAIAHLNETLRVLLPHLSVGAEVHTPNGRLRVADASGEQVVLSADGAGYLNGQWHEGAVRPVYVERYGKSSGRRLFHGHVDAQSRKIVQAG